MFSKIKSSSEDQGKTSDESSSSSSSPIEGKCYCTKHLDKIVLDQIYPIDIDQLYRIIYENHSDGCNEQGHSFTERIHRSRKIDDLITTEWKPLSDDERIELPKQMKMLSVNIMDDIDLNRIWKRECKCTIHLNHVLCRQTVTRRQQYRLQYDVGKAFVVYSQIRNESAPFSDSFVINTSWCATSTPDRCGETRLIVRFQISWIKSSLSLSMLKSTIEKSSFQGVVEYHRDMFQLLDDDLASNRIATERK